jgi:Fe-S-cluster containining protein
MSESLNICLSCGFCCDGSLIGFVELSGEELPRLRKLMDIEQFDESGFFFLPCKNLGGDGCKIYSQRPRQCGRFECGMLKSIEKKELDFDSALEEIKVFKQKKIAIEKQFGILPFKLKSQSFYFKILELKKWLQKDDPEVVMTQNFSDLLSELEEINHLALKSFGISYF